MSQEVPSLNQDPQFIQTIYEEVKQVVSELLERAQVKSSSLLVIGCSTSEVIGRQIGKAGVAEVAEAIFRAVQDVRSQRSFYPVFQCCEHLNRALVMERAAAEIYGYDEVSVVPVMKAGGAMAAHAYQSLVDSCVVEKVKAHTAIDIGATLIGMHLREVAVPFRPSIRSVGQAQVTAAFTRPKLIGGTRAVYDTQTS